MRASRLLLAGAVAAAALLAPPAGAQAPAALTVRDYVADRRGLDQTAARVDGAVITRGDLVQALEGLPGQVQDLPADNVLPLLLERLIDQQLLAAEGRRRKLAETDAVKRRVADYEGRLIAETLLQSEIEKRLTDAELKRRYAEFLKANPPQEETRARHILVETEKEARDALAEIRRGKDFAEVAKARSKDGSAGDGGDLGFFSREDMVKEFADAAFALKPGEVTPTPVKSQFGWHLIKAEERRVQAAPTFEEAREQLASEASQDMITLVLEDLRKAAKIERSPQPK